MDLTGVDLDGRYHVIAPIAEGAMGVVYRAERLKLGRIVAIKVLHDTLPDELSSRKRFEIEAMAMAKLEHPHCAAVVDVGVHDGKPYVVMDFVSGENLKDVIARERLPQARVVEIMRQVLSGLAHAHELDIVHRDIKPANIMLSQKAGLGDHVKILDFGLARFSKESNRLTVGIVVGTPSYMAPEQCSGGTIDARTDLYACGVMLYEMLEGKKPFYSASDDPVEVVRMHLNQPPPRASGELAEVVARALQKKPAARFQSAVEMSGALDAFRTRPSTQPVVARAELSWSVPNAAPGSAPIPMASSQPASAPIPVGSGPTSAPIPIGNGPASAPIPASIPTSGPIPAGSGPASAPISPPPSIPFGATAPSMLPPPSRPSGQIPRGPASAPVAIPDIASAPIAVTSPPAAAAGFRPTQRQLVLGGAGALLLIILIATIANHHSSDAPTPGDAAVARTTPPPPPPPPPGDIAGDALARAERMVADGRTEEAIRLLASARQLAPSSPELAVMAGKLYFGKLWFSDGIAAFRAAAKLQPSLATDPDIIKIVLKGFNTTPRYDGELASYLHDVAGPAAKPFLEETAKGHTNPTVRSRAAAELKRYP